MNVQWIVRAHILGVVQEADSGIGKACLKWFPDHPDKHMNVSSLDPDDFWNDPYPERALGLNVVEEYFRSPTIANPVSVVLTLSSAVREGIANTYETH